MKKALSKTLPEQHSVLFCGVTKASVISELILIEEGVKSGNELDGNDLPNHRTFTSLLRSCKQHCPDRLDSNLLCWLDSHVPRECVLERNTETHTSGRGQAS